MVYPFQLVKWGETMSSWLILENKGNTDSLSSAVREDLAQFKSLSISHDTWVLPWVSHKLGAYIRVLLKSQTSLGTASQSSEVVISQVVFFILLIFVEMQLLSCKHLFKLTLYLVHMYMWGSSAGVERCLCIVWTRSKVDFLQQ